MQLFLLLFMKIGKTHDKYFPDQNDRKIFSCDILFISLKQGKIVLGY